MLRLRWHHTLGYGGLGVGILLTLAGVALALRHPGHAGASGQRIPRSLGALKLPGGKRTRGVIVAAIIIGATMGTFVYAEYQLSSQSGGPFGLSLGVDSATEVTYPNGNVGVTVLAAATGGIPPYTYTAVWSDDSNQTSTTGNFTRLFQAGSQISTGLTITAKSSNSGLGNLFLSLPTPAVNGLLSTRTLGIIPSNGAPGSQVSGSATSTQTKTTAAFIAVVNASTPTVSTSTVSASSSTSNANGSTTSTPLTFEVEVIVEGTSGHLVKGATVSIDGNLAQITPLNGTVFFFGVSGGVHTCLVSYGTWNTTVPWIAQGSSALRFYVDVPGQ
jgi:hypothetical protein